MKIIKEGLSLFGLILLTSGWKVVHTKPEPIDIIMNILTSTIITVTIIAVIIVLILVLVKKKKKKK